MGGGSGGGFGKTKGSGNTHGFPTNLHKGKQGKHIVGHNNYKSGKSIFNGTMNEAQKLINQFAGKGQWIGANKERVNFGRNIGLYIDGVTGTVKNTTIGTIHYSSTGAHIVPAAPLT